MTQLQAILSYQEKDKVLFALEKELHASEARKTSRKMKAFIVEAAEKLDLLETKAKQLKGALKDLEEKCAHAEEALKDFVGLDELVDNGGDVAFYKKKALSLQANLKKLTADIQAAMAQVNATHEEYQKLKKQVIVAQKKGKEAQEEYEKNQGGTPRRAHGFGNGACGACQGYFARKYGALPEKTQGKDFPRRWEN